MLNETLDNPEAGADAADLSTSEGTGATGNPTPEAQSDLEIAANGTAGNESSQAEPEQNDIYSGNPADLDPNVYNSHFKPMQAGYTRKMQSLAEKERELNAKMAEFESQKSAWQTDLKSSLTAPSAPAPEREPESKPEAPAFLTGEELRAKVAELHSAGRKTEALEFLIEQRAGAQAHGMASALESRFDKQAETIASLQADLKRALAPVEDQAQRGQVSAAYRTLIEQDPTFDSTEVKEIAADRVNRSKDVADAVASGNQAWITSAVRAESMQALRDWEIGRTKKAAARAKTQPKTPDKPHLETSLATGVHPSIDDLLDDFVRKEPETATRLRFH